MKKLWLALGVAAALTAPSAYATLVLTTEGPDATGIDNAAYIAGASNPTDQQIVDALNATTPGLGLTLSGLPPRIFKNDRDGNIYSGALAGSYLVDYDPDNGTGIATIMHVAGQPFVNTPQLTWLLAKDGAAGHYLWNLTGIWNGTETIQINDLWPDTGSFSHIEIGGAVVPEPTTVIAGALLLLPFGLSTLRVLRKTRRA
jgi:hypothetical protein